MLIRLICHELRSTGRKMLPLLALLLLSALGANVSIRKFTASSQPLLRALGTVLIVLFVIALAGAIATVFTNTLRRFRSNLLQDEGYLTMTLPVSVHQHLFCKLLVPGIWFALTAVCMALSVRLMMQDVPAVRDFFLRLREDYRTFQEIFSASTSYDLDGLFSNLTAPAVLAMIGATTLIGVLTLCMQCYAAMAVGHSFSRSKTLLSLLMFFLLGIALRFLGDGLNVVLYVLGLDEAIVTALNGLRGVPWLVGNIGIVLASEVLSLAVFYIVAAFFLKYRLNLD